MLYNDTKDIMLSVIIVNYNAKNLLKNCIDSIYKSNNKINFEIIVIDNASQDGSRQLITNLYKDVKWIQNDKNVGFAAANNKAIINSRGKYCLLLNNDTIVLEKAFDKLVDFIEKHNEAGAVGPRVLNEDGTLQRSCRRGLPNAINSFGYFTKLYKIFPKSKALGSYAMSYVSDNISHEVEALSGAAMLIRTDLLKKLHGLDEKFFMHFEDIDLCLRIGRMGYKLYYVHDSQIIHIKGQSSKLRSKKIIYDYHNSLKYYYKKNYSQKKSFVSNMFVYFFIWARKVMCISMYNIKSLIK